MKQLPKGPAEPVRGATARLAQHCAIARFVAQHPKLALYVVRQQGPKLAWQALDESAQVPLPASFERRKSALAELAEHHAALCSEAAESRQLVWRERQGFSDFAYLLSEGTQERLLLVALQCAAAPLDYKALEQSYATLTDAPTPQPPNADFTHYVTVALTRPLVTERLCSELSEFCELFRSFVEVDQERESEPPPVFGQSPRARLEAGVIAIAISPIDATRAGRDPLRALVDARRLLHEAQSFACDFEGAVALPLEDYGALLTVPVQSKTPPQAADAKRLAEKARQLAHRRLSLATVAGTAVALAEPESREAVAQRAVLALRMALETGQSVLLLEDAGARAKPVRNSHVLQALDRLSSTFEREAMTEAAAMAHGFIHTVGTFSGGRLDIVRAQFVHAVTQIAKAIQRRHCLATEMPERWGDEAAQKLDACSSLEELTDELKRTLNRLASLATQHDGPSYLRIDELTDYLRHNLSEPIKLPHLARRAGFSVPSFCRVFKRATGHSLLSYVRRLRIDRAKHLLATTELPNTSVAELSGFHSQHHFIRSFKKVMSSTPGEYRRALGLSAELGA